MALAAALFHPEEIADEAVIVTVSGGNVDGEIFAEALRRFPA